MIKRMLQEVIAGIIITAILTGAFWFTCNKIAEHKSKAALASSALYRTEAHND